MNSVTYLAAIAEDTWFYEETPARHITERIQNVQNHYNADVAIANARDVLGFLWEQRTRNVAAANAIVDPGTYEQLSDISSIPSAIDALERSLTTPSWAAAYGRFPAKSNATGTVANVKDFGVFVELEPGISGLIPATRLPLGFKKLEQFSYGERIVVEIQSVNAIRKRIDMSYIGPAPEENLSGIEQLTLEMFPPSDTNPS